LKKLLVALGLVLLGGALALLGQHLLFPISAREDERLLAELERRQDLQAQQLSRAEERFKADMQLALVGFLRLLEFRRFAELGQDLALVVVASPGAAQQDALSEAAAAGGGVKLPRVVLDNVARREWSDLGQRLAGLKDGVDPRVFEAFQTVREFATSHPWPTRGDLGTIARSNWARSVTIDRWLALNKNLSSRVVAVVSQFNPQP
jgi:hypothetical protein